MLRHCTATLICKNRKTLNFGNRNWHLRMLMHSKLICILKWFKGAYFSCSVINELVIGYDSFNGFQTEQSVRISRCFSFHFQLWIELFGTVWMNRFGTVLVACQIQTELIWMLVVFNLWLPWQNFPAGSNRRRWHWVKSLRCNRPNPRCFSYLIEEGKTKSVHMIIHHC